jgi:hypothetical protein
MYKSKPDAEWLELKRKTLICNNVTPDCIADKKAILLSKGYRITDISFFSNHGTPLVKVVGEKEKFVKYQSPYI